MEFFKLIFNISIVIIIASILTLSIRFIGLEPTVVAVLSNLIFQYLDKEDKQS
jgi:hypothetical protein